MTQRKVVNVVPYKCFDMHGYIVEATISCSPDRLAVWPRKSELGFGLEEKVGPFGALIVREIFRLTGIKGLWIDQHEVIIHREKCVQWEELEGSIIGIMEDSSFLAECLAREMLEEITEEHVLCPLDECQLETLEKYYRGC